MTGTSSIRAVIFDWDGTLLDSYHADARAYQKMFAALGIEWSVAQLEHHYSPDWYRVYRAAGVPRNRWQEADRIWRRFYAREVPALMPGARRVLRALARRYVLAVVTSGNRTRVLSQLRGFGFRKLFAALVCSEDAHRRKPHPAPLQLALRKLKLEPEACLYVGDSPEDVEMARRAGVRVIGVFGPFPNHRRLRTAGADLLLESLRELPRALRKL